MPVLTTGFISSINTIFLRGSLPVLVTGFISSINTIFLGRLRTILNRRRWDSNPRILVLQTNALGHLATPPKNKSEAQKSKSKSAKSQYSYFAFNSSFDIRYPDLFKKWAGLESNQRRLAPTGLQPVPFGRSGTDPFYYLRQSVAVA